MHFSIITLFPEAFDPYLSLSLIGTARAKGVMNTRLVNLRDYAGDKHRTVDDTPYGGGAGMVMKVEPIDKALQELAGNKKSRTVVLSARGEQFTQQKAQEYAGLEALTLICGRYEGIDQRVADHLADEELSIGPYVLAGGELAALVVIEAVTRLLPGVLGNPESLTEESFTEGRTTTASGMGPLTSLVEYPQYTTPAEYRGWKVPEVLLSGDHGVIREWRERQRRA